MRVYYDIFTEAELLSDVYSSMKVTDTLVTVIGEKVPKEDGEDGETEWDIVQDHLLIKYDGDTAIDKKTFTAMIKRYLVQLKKELEKTKPDRVKAFQAEAQAYIGEILKDFGNCEFYHGQIDYDVQEHKLEAMKQECKEAGGDPETVKPLQEQIVVLRWIDGSIPTFHFFTDGMRSEKC